MEMMKIFSLFIVSLFGCMSLFAQEKGFVIKGRIPGMYRFWQQRKICWEVKVLHWLRLR